MKTCSKCRTEKPLDEFYPRKGGKFGVRADCKVCVIKRSVKWGKDHPAERNAQNKKWRDEHPDEFRDMVYAWNAAHPEQAAANRAAWADANPEKIRAATDMYQRENPVKVAAQRARSIKKHSARVNATNARRQARKLQATPKWANEFFIEEIYALAKLRTELTGFEWQVDHIVPLRSKKVSGLHWEGNLQVIPAKVNMQKGNRYWPDMPEKPSQSAGQ